MSEPDPSLDSKLRRVHDHVEAARAARGVDGVRACNEARQAAEGMLVLLAERADVTLREKREKPPTLESMKSRLRHAGVIDKKMVDLVGTIQRYGNRAVHFQAEEGQALDEAESELAVDALEALVPHFETRLGHVLPRRPARRWLGWLLTPVLAIGLLVGTFFATIGVLAVVDGDRPAADGAGLTELPRVDAYLSTTPAAPPDTTPEAAEVSPPTRPVIAPEPGLDERGDPADSTGFERAVAMVRLHRPLDNEALVDLRCDDLTRLRTWIWAERGYHVRDGDLGRWMARQEGYHDRGLDHVEVAPRFLPVDEHNRDVLNDRMRAAGCDCPRPLTPRRPCPL